MPDLTKVSLIEHYSVHDMQLTCNCPIIHSSRYSSASNTASVRLKAREGSEMSKYHIGLNARCFRPADVASATCRMRQPSTIAHHPLGASQLDGHLSITVNSFLHTLCSVVISHDAA